MQILPMPLQRKGHISLESGYDSMLDKGIDLLVWIGKVVARLLAVLANHARGECGDKCDDEGFHISKNRLLQLTEAEWMFS